MPRLYSFAFAPLLLAALAAPAMAQETLSPGAQGVSDRDGVIAYTPADFAAARPNTAFDMINRLPGFTFDGGDQVRGFAGAAGNVLIDGQRPTSKTDQLSDTLQRIPIGQVERIDLIRGGAPGIDMQGRTVIANVIRKRADSFQQVVSLNDAIFTTTGHNIPGWSYQATRRSGEHQLDFTLSRGQSYDDSVGLGQRTRLDLPTGNLLVQNSETEADGLVHSARLNYKGPLAGGTFSANGLISTDEFKDEEHFFSAGTNEHYVSRSANDRAEVGLNYKRALGDQFELETLVLSKWAQGAADSTGADGSSTSLFKIAAEAGESIGRSILRYSPSQTLSFEGGGEVAYNYRQQQIALVVNGAAIALPASDVKIEELRGEAFAQSTWRASPLLSFEAGVRIEHSKITESGDTSLERAFTYPKPSLAMTWSPSKEDQLRLRIERKVGQLNFQDFISSVNLSSNVLSAGNAQLRPDQRWSYEAAFEKRFWGNAAVVMTLRHEDISDVVDVFPFLVNVDANGDGIPDDANKDGQPDQKLVSGPGNIGDGKNDAVELNFTLPLERFGLVGGEFKVTSSWQNGEVTDPLTHQKRTISGQRPNNINVSYRQDMPAQNLTWGVNWFAGWSEHRYLLQEVDILRLRNFFASFIEYKPNPGFTLRAELDNFDPYKFTLERDVFGGPRGASNLSTIEIERRKSQVIAQVRARWTIG
jgi:Outer membrane protein beta-barrel family